MQDMKNQYRRESCSSPSNPFSSMCSKLVTALKQIYAFISKKDFRL